VLLSFSANDPIGDVFEERLSHRDTIVDVVHAWDSLDDVFGNVLHATVLDTAGERHLAIIHLDLDVASVHVVVFAQAFADVLANAIVRPGVALWATA